MVCCGWANLFPQPPELKIKATGAQNQSHRKCSRRSKSPMGYASINDIQKVESTALDRGAHRKEENWNYLGTTPGSSRATAACERTSGGVPLFPAPMAELSGGGFSPLLLVGGNRGAVAVMQQLSDVLSIAGRRRSVSSSPSRTSMAPSLRDGTPSSGIPLFPDDARWRTAATALLSRQA
nr:homeobox-DDT domain protein RLT1 [Ipomoea batatas]